MRLQVLRAGQPDRADHQGHAAEQHNPERDRYFIVGGMDAAVARILQIGEMLDGLLVTSTGGSQCRLKAKIRPPQAGKCRVRTRAALMTAERGPLIIDEQAS